MHFIIGILTEQESSIIWKLFKRIYSFEVSVVLPENVYLCQNIHLAMKPHYSCAHVRLMRVIPMHCICGTLPLVLLLPMKACLPLSQLDELIYRENGCHFVLHLLPSPVGCSVLLLLWTSCRLAINPSKRKLKQLHCRLDSMPLLCEQ